MPSHFTSMSGRPWRAGPTNFASLQPRAGSWERLQACLPSSPTEALTDWAPTSAFPHLASSFLPTSGRCCNPRVSRVIRGRSEPAAVGRGGLGLPGGRPSSRDYRLRLRGWQGRRRPPPLPPWHFGPGAGRRAFLGARPPNPGRAGPSPDGPKRLREAAAQSSLLGAGDRNSNRRPARGRHLARLRPQGLAVVPARLRGIDSACALEPWTPALSLRRAP